MSTTAPEWPTTATQNQYLSAGGDVGFSGAGMRQPRAGECDLCANVPAIPVTLGRQQGLILFMRSWDLSGTYCRDCGLETFRAAQNATIAGGWWGLLSFFFTIRTLTRNTRSYVKLRALSPPIGRDAGVDAPNAAPLRVGPPVLARWGTKVALLILVAWIVLANVVD